MCTCISLCFFLLSNSDKPEVVGQLLRVTPSTRYTSPRCFPRASDSETFVLQILKVLGKNSILSFCLRNRDKAELRASSVSRNELHFYNKNSLSSGVHPEHKDRNYVAQWMKRPTCRFFPFIAFLAGSVEARNSS